MFVAILFLHWLSDFCAQPHWMAANKARKFDALFAHCALYTFIMIIGFSIAINMYDLPAYWTTNYPRGDRIFLFAVVTFVTHFITDAITSRISGHLFKTAMDNQKDPTEFGRAIHDFFVVIGFDQFVHLATLYYTLKLLGYGLV